MSNEKSVQFGFETTTPANKTARVGAVFDSVASRYDLMNDLMSAGLHRLWKRFAIDCLAVRAGHTVLDLACGSADLARLVAARHGAEVRLICSDINAAMLAHGRDKMLNAGVVAGVDYVRASAESLPLPANSVDRIVIGFGLRNVTDKPQALAEMARVLAPGGRAVVLEFSRVRAPLLAAAYERYSFSILPWLGERVAGDGDSYRYLAESIQVHPDQDALQLLMERSGFEAVRYYNLIAGLVAVHVGCKY